MRKTCFISNGRSCDSSCMAFSGEGEVQACTLLDAATGLVSFFLSAAKSAQAVVRHPPSPPAPEVR